MPRAAITADTFVRASARVATIAAELDMDPSQVRRLIAAGELDSYRSGKRGIRIYRDSVEAYQLRRTRPAQARAADTPGPKRPPAAASRAAHQAAMAALHKAGVV